MCCGPSWRSLERSVSEVVTSTDAETPQTPPSQRFLPADVTPNHDSQPAATAGYTARRVAALAAVVLAEVLRTVVFAVTVAYVLYPICQWLVGRGLSRRIACVGTTVIAFVAAAILVVPLLYVLYRRRAELIEILEQIPDVVPISVGGFELVIEMVPYVAAAEVWVRQVALALAAAARRGSYSNSSCSRSSCTGSSIDRVRSKPPSSVWSRRSTTTSRRGSTSGRERRCTLDLRPAGGDGRGDVRARIRGVLGLRVRVTGLACRHRRRPPVHPHYRPESVLVVALAVGDLLVEGDRAGDCRASTRSRPRLLRPRRGDPDAARRLDRKDLSGTVLRRIRRRYPHSRRGRTHRRSPRRVAVARSDRHALRARRAARPDRERRGAESTD